MSEKQEKLVIVVSENVITSLVKDVGTFLVFGGLLYFNHRVLSGNGWIDALFILIVVMWLSSLSFSTIYRGNKAGAIKWLGDK